MSFALYQLFLIGAVYLLLLFGIAHIAERGWLPESLIRHPMTYVLSLGVYAGASAIYGVVGLAHNYGYGFLTYYLGVAGVFFFAPLLLFPLLRIVRTNIHSSLADVLTFRYHSQWAGSLITIFMLLSVWPLLALQIQAVTDSLIILSSEDNNLYSQETRQFELAFLFCIALCVFTISFGSRHLTVHERHNGLVMAIAFESLVKLFVLLVVGAVAVFHVFGGFDGIEQWLLQNPQYISKLSAYEFEAPSRAMLLIFFSAAVAMPHMFHMTFAESPSARSLLTASWGVPLFLLLMSLPVLPILWAGIKLQPAIPSEYFSLGIGIELQSGWLAMLVFVGGLSAASGVVIVTTLALASMCLKHLILPIYRPSTDRDIYRWLLWIRRVLIVFIILTGFVFFRFIAGRETLADLGIAAFVATLQFLPGVMAALYWQRANRIGFIAGLITGFLIWFVMLLLPIVSDFDSLVISNLFTSMPDEQRWSLVAIASLAINIVVFVMVSLSTPMTEEERMAAEVCSTDDLNRPARRVLSVNSPAQMKEKLSAALGIRMAQREVDRALSELNLPASEQRPFALRRLRYRLEANLSGLMGPAVANDIVNRLLPYASDLGESSGEDINLIEGQLESYKRNLTGLAADLDNLRRYHRQTLQSLPVGVCSLGRDNEILMWNDSIAQFTGIDTFEVVGSSLQDLPDPWGNELADFLATQERHSYKQCVEVEGQQFWFNLHKTLIDPSEPNAAMGDTSGRVIVLEDATDIHLLEDELLHSERLASIGRLAAGVAHEIGNPVTGIACLAQNLRYDTDNPSSLETADEILVQTDRVSKIVQTLVNFAHSGKGGHQALQSVSIKDCVDEAMHLLRLNKDAKPVRFENYCDEAWYAYADAQRLLQVFVNLLSNARDASPEDSLVSVNCQKDGQQLLIQVVDRGVGISKEHQEQIFDPFFTTKEPGEGTGLGLSLVYSIVDELNGSISVESPVDLEYGGTCFSIRLKQYERHHEPEEDTV